MSVIEECPSVSCTTAKSTPETSISDAARWCRSCNRTGGRLAATTRSWNRSLTTAGCSGSPFSRVNTLPESAPTSAQPRSRSRWPCVLTHSFAPREVAAEEYDTALAAWESAEAALARVRLAVQRDGGTFSARRGWRPSDKAKEVGRQLPKLSQAAATARLARDVAGAAVAAARVAQREVYEQTCARVGRFEPRSNIGLRTRC